MKKQLCLFAAVLTVADDVGALLAKVEVRHEAAYDVGGMMKRGQARVAVTFNDGQRIVVERAMSRAFESPQSTDEVAAKYRTLTAGHDARRAEDHGVA